MAEETFRQCQRGNFRQRTQCQSSHQRLPCRCRSPCYGSHIDEESSMRRNKPRAFLIGIPLAAMLAASTTSWGAPTLVSGPSPFASCTVGGPCTVYVNAEVEPWMAVHPADP